MVKNIPFFQNLSQEEVQQLLAKPSVTELKFAKGSFVFQQDDEPKFVYILLSGVVQVEAIGESGRRLFLNRFSEPGSVFAEVFAFLPHKRYDYSCRAIKDSRVLAIDRDFLRPEDNEDPIAQKLLIGMLTILSEKAFMLNQKLLIVGEMTLRSKIIKYLQKKSEIDGIADINFNREEMADFLGTTRPSLSRELKKMENEGIITISRRLIHINEEKSNECY